MSNEEKNLHELAGLGEDLDSDIVGNEVLLNQGAQESVLCLGGGGKTNLYLLKPYLAEELEEEYRGAQMQ